nr:hypothetical protein [Tanacetum cinerariifolium]
MHQPPEESIKEFEKQLKTVVISALEGVIQPLQEISLQEMEDLKQQYLDEMKSLINIKDYRNEKIDIEIKINELKKKFNGINKKKKLQQLEQVANLGTYPSQHFNSFYYDDDDDEEFSIPMSEIYKSSLTVITTSPPVLPTKDLEDSLIMENEELSTIPEKKSDKFINDDESLSDEDVSDDNFKIYSNPLFEFDDEYISSDVNPLFDAVLEDIECKDSYDSNLDESAFLVTLFSMLGEDEYFTPSDDVELLLQRDTSTPMMSVVSVPEGFTDEPPLEKNDDLFNLESKEIEWKKILIAWTMKTLVLVVLSIIHLILNP